jgi:hypothetical protein
MHGQALRTWLMAVEPPDMMLMRIRERNKMVTQAGVKRIVYFQMHSRLVCNVPSEHAARHIASHHM